MSDHIDRMVGDWLSDGPERGPRDGLERTLAATRSVRQRPWWAASNRWPALVPSIGRAPVALWAVLLIALLLGIAAIALIVGSRPRLPSPFGVAGNGLVAYSQGGTVYLERPGESPRPLTGGGVIDSTPTFSRDGTRFTFWSQDVADGPLTLWIANADGSGVRPLTPAGDVQMNPVFSQSWSPDGSLVYFAAREGDIERVWVVPADGSAGPRPVTATDATRGASTLSPDGRWLAYVRTTFGPDATEAVVIANADGTGEHEVYSHPAPADGGYIFGPQWAPDSSAVTYSRATYMAEEPDRGGRAVLAVAPVGGREQIIYEHGTGNLLSWPSYSPDGRWIAFGTGDHLEVGTIELVHPDGTERHTIYRGTGQGGLDCWAQWAPDATALVATCAPYAVVPIEPSGRVPDIVLPPDATQLDWQRVAPPSP
jgi:Tol biopolymer transport system component